MRGLLERLEERNALAHMLLNESRVCGVENAFERELISVSSCEC